MADTSALEAVYAAFNLGIGVGSVLGAVGLYVGASLYAAWRDRND